jgi:thioredoxin 1
MKPLSAIWFVLALGAGTACGELPADWNTNYDATLAAAATSQQPALVYFTAGWCGPCKLMTRITLADPAVTQALANVGHVVVDIDEHPDLASARDINAVPTFVMLSAGGDEVDRATGFQAVGDFLDWFTNGISGAQAAAARLALAKQVLAEADQLLAVTATNATRLAATKLFDLCAMRDDAVVQAAAARLRILATRDSALVLNGLDDPRLATRIQAANALRAAIGDSFDADPWSVTEARQKTIAVWREKLAQSTSAGKSTAQP